MKDAFEGTNRLLYQNNCSRGKTCGLTFAR